MSLLGQKQSFDFIQRWLQLQIEKMGAAAAFYETTLTAEGLKILMERDNALK